MSQEVWKCPWENVRSLYYMNVAFLNHLKVYTAYTNWASKDSLLSPTLKWDLKTQNDTVRHIVESIQRLHLQWAVRTSFRRKGLLKVAFHSHYHSVIMWIYVHLVKLRAIKCSHFKSRLTTSHCECEESIK